MLLITQVKKTYSLLDQKSKRRLLFFGTIQLGLGVLDLIAIIVVGLLSYCASAYLGISNLSGTTKRILELSGLPLDNLGRTIIYLIVLATSLLILKSIVSIILLKRIFSFLARIDAEISEKFALAFLKSNYNLINSISSQEATYLISRGLHIGEVLGAGTVIIAELGMLFLLSSLILIAEPVLAFTLILYFFVFFYLNQKKLGKWMRQNSAEYSDSAIKCDQIFQDGIALYKEIFTKDKISYLVGEFSKYRHKVTKSTANMQLIGYIPKLTFESALILGAFIIGAQQLFLNSVEGSIATTLMFLTAGSRILPSLLRLQSATSSIQNFSGGSEAAFNLISKIDRATSPQVIPGVGYKMPSAELNPTVYFQDVNFVYPGESRFSIKDLGFSVPQQTSLAIVGKTGSGKSTVVDLMLGILEIQSGKITIGGLSPIEAIRQWPGSIGYVPQVVAFINGSVRENIAFGVDASRVDEDQVWTCLKMVQLESLFQQSPLGLDTLVGERGMRLSGGQRQRLGIARALYSNPLLLILDEATSALDAETEQVIATALKSLSRKMTLIVVAHRINTVQTVDRVLYLDDGQLIAMGSFTQVRSLVPNFERQAKLMGL
jgi:ATP-binding cassette subfamily C protein